MAKESDFQKRILKWLSSKELYAVKYNASGIGRNGTPDIFVNLDGLFLTIEVKKDHKEGPTMLQSIIIKKINDSGGIAIVLRPESFDLFKSIVECYLVDDDDTRNVKVKIALLKQIGVK